jgi:hypothetical protein
MIENITVASIYIPDIIVDSFAYVAGSDIDKLAIIEKYSPLVVFYNSLFFYTKAIERSNTYIDFDDFNFIPLTHDEIVMLIYHANQFDTLMTGKLFANRLRVKYIP